MKLKTMLYALLLALTLTGPVLGALINSAATGDWNVGATWVGGSEPNPATDEINILNTHVVTITDGDTVTLSGDGEIGINNGGELVVASGGVLALDGNQTVQNLGTFDLQSGGTLNLINGNFFHGFGATSGESTIAGELNIGASSLFEIHTTGSSVVVSGTVNIEGTTSRLDLGSATTITFSTGSVLNINTGGRLYPFDNATATFESGSSCVLGGGKIYGSTSAGTVDVASPITGSGTIDWGDGLLSITGGLNLTAVTHENTTGAVLTVDADGTLDLGTDTANSIAVDVAANVTIGDHFTCLGFDGSSGVITGAAKTITVGSGGLTNGGATLDAVGTLNIIVAETPAAFDWAAANSNHSLGTLTVNAATTMTDTVFTTKVAGSAAIAVDSRLYVRAMAANFWTNTATHSGSSQVVMYAYSGSHANTALINIGTCEFQVMGGNGATTTLTGGLTCGVLDLDATAQNLVVNGPLSASGNTTLDDATLTLGSAATHSFGGTITSGSTSILIIDGTSTFTGAVDTTGITLTVAAASTVVFSDTLTIGDTATFTAGITSFTADGFVLNAAGKTLTGGGNTITATDVTYTAGALDAAGTLNVEMVGTGGLSWDSVASSLLCTVTFSGTTTAGNVLTCQKIAGSGTAIGNNQYLDLHPAADDFWTLETEADGFAGVYVSLGATNRKNATLIDIGSSPFVFYQYAKNLTLTGGLACGTLTLSAFEGAATLDMDGGNLNCTTFKFDEDDGAVLLGEGTHNITGVIERLTGDETGCSVDFETSHVTLDGHATFAEMAVGFGSARIDTGAVTFNGATATSISNAGAIITGRTGAVTLSNIDTNWNAGDPPIFARRWVDGTGNGVRVQTLAPHWLMGMR